MLLPRAQVPPWGASSPGTTETPTGLTGSSTMHQGLEEQAPTVPIHSTVPPDPSPRRLSWAGEPKPGSSPRPQAEGRGGRRRDGGAQGLDCWENEWEHRAAAERAFVVT